MFILEVIQTQLSNQRTNQYQQKKQDIKSIIITLKLFPQKIKQISGKSNNEIKGILQKYF